MRHDYDERRNDVNTNDVAAAAEFAHTRPAHSILTNQ